MVAAGSGEHLYDYDMQTKNQDKFVSHSVRTLPFLYPAFAALLFVPFSLVSYRLAFFFFSLVNLCLLGAAGVWMRLQLPLLRRGPSWLPGYLFLTFFPVSIAIMQGQLSVLLLSIYTVSFILQRRHHHLSSGLFLAGALMKFQLVVPVVLLWICWRQWRALAGFGIGSLVLVAISLAVTGPHGAMQYAHNLLNMTREGLQSPYAAHLRYGMFPADMPNLHGFFFLMTHGGWIGQALALLCSAALMAWAAMQSPSFAVALTAAMMVSYHMQAYDLTLLLLPLAITMNHLSEDLTVRTDQPQPRPSTARGKALWGLSVSIAILLVPTAPFLLIKGLCGLFAWSVLGILWTSAYLPSSTGDRSDESLSPITAPLPC